MKQNPTEMLPSLLIAVGASFVSHRHPSRSTKQIYHTKPLTEGCQFPGHRSCSDTAGCVDELIGRRRLLVPAPITTLTNKLQDKSICRCYRRCAIKHSRQSCPRREKYQQRAAEFLSWLCAETTAKYSLNSANLNICIYQTRLEQNSRHVIHSRNRKKRC